MFPFTHYINNSYYGRIPAHIDWLRACKKAKTTYVHHKNCQCAASNKTFTTSLNNITCPKCLKYIKRCNWYCKVCGFLDPENVTNTEMCDICGGDLQ